MSNSECTSMRHDFLNLPIITGVDWSDGLSRVNGNEQLYNTLLRLFFQSDSFDKLCGAIKSRDFVCARYEAHSMKGTAANLGFLQISRCADRIDLNLKNSQYDQAIEVLAKLEDAYRTAHTAINNL